MILHWFSGSRRELERASALGCWFSVGPAMIRSQRGRDLLGAMPRERVLTETDGPFAAGKEGPLRPGEVTDAIMTCARIWGIASDEAAAAIAGNLRALGKMATA